MTTRISSRATSPNALLLSRATDRLSFLYVERARVHQSDHGTEINPHDHPDTSLDIPGATLSCLLLGHGTSITQPAISRLTRLGCAVAFVGQRGGLHHGIFPSVSTNANLLIRQAAIVSDPELRRQAAERMYRIRFADLPDLPTGTTIEQMRGLEGIRMRATYAALAKQHRITGWRRNTTPADPPETAVDHINAALNTANAALYGITSSVLTILGLSTGLGIIHTGLLRSFTLDIADLYKAEITLPAAFAAHRAPEPHQAVLRHLRGSFTLLKLMPRIVEDTLTILDPDHSTTPADEWDTEELLLWGPTNIATAGNNHSAVTLLPDP